MATGSGGGSARQSTLESFVRKDGSSSKPQRVQSGPLRHAAEKPKRFSPLASSGRSEVESCGGARVKAGASKLVFSETRGDLFKCPSSSSLAHCVSEDLHMGKGIATIFKKEFGGVAELRRQGVQPGGVAVLEKEGRYIYYLVTKKRYFHKPTYDSLRCTLEAMHTHIVSNGVTQLSMPRIGCGLDQLKWERVVQMIRDIFSDVDMTITIYYL